MSNPTRRRRCGRYSPVWVALLGMIASIAWWDAPAHAAASAPASCGNAPEAGAEYLSDPCAWADLRGSEQVASGHKAKRFAPQDRQWRSGRGAKPAAQ